MRNRAMRRPTPVTTRTYIVAVSMDAAAPPRMGRPRLFALASAVEWARLERNFRQSPEAVRADQAARLRRALADAQHVPFWREHLGTTDTVDSVEDLARLPTIDKPALRTVPEHDRLYGPIPPGTRTLETSGTSGVPLVVHYSPRGAWQQGVLRLRSTHHRGLRPWDRTAGATFSTTALPTPGLVGSVRRARRVNPSR